MRRTCALALALALAGCQQILGIEDGTLADDDDDDGDTLPGELDAGNGGTDPGTAADAGTVGPPSSCNPVFPECPAGLRCGLLLDSFDPLQGHYECVEQGGQPLGGPCQFTALGTPDQCMAGLQCTDGKCRQICHPDFTDCSSGQTCNTLGGFPFGSCLIPCNVLAPSCPEGEGCYGLPPDSTSAVCVTAGTIPEGGSCMFLNDCIPGTGCFTDLAGGSSCHRFCAAFDCVDPDSGAPNACGCSECSATQVCVPVTPDPTIGPCVEAVEVGCDCGDDPVCPTP